MLTCTRDRTIVNLEAYRVVMPVMDMTACVVILMTKTIITTKISRLS